MLAGLGGIAALWAGNVTLGPLHLGVHTMLYAAMAVLVGYQAVIFSVFTKIFAISEGLLPPDPTLKRMFRYITLESGLIAGGVLLLLSAAGSVWALAYWTATSYGPLDPARMLRLVIPAVLAMVLGSQTVLSSFFLSVLGLRIRRAERSLSPAIAQPAPVGGMQMPED